MNRCSGPLLYAALLTMASLAPAEEKSQTVDLAGGAMTIRVPADWVAKPPASRMLEHEFQTPAAEGAVVVAGRLTVMRAGGGLQANLDRWVGQFRDVPAGGSETSAIDAGGIKATMLDIRGTFLESSGGPFGPKTPRENYRMLGAVAPTPDQGTYFFKLVGPAATIELAEEGFREMIASLQRK